MFIWPTVRVMPCETSTFIATASKYLLLCHTSVTGRQHVISYNSAYLKRSERMSWQCLLK